MARALAAVLLASAEADIRGVAPADQAQYAAGAFACSGRQLPPDAVNDNFCDCEDGSDEPGTEACAGLGSTLYYCANEQSDPLYIYASRVNDGVCDCCDGSDEWQAERRQTACPNICAEEGRSIRKERSRKIADLHSGIKQRETLIANAKAARVKSDQELQKLKAELPQLEAALEEAKSQLDAAQSAVAAEAAAAKNLTGQDNTSAASVPADGVKEVAEAPPAAEEGSGQEAKEADAKPVVSEYSKWMDGAEKVLEEAAEVKPEVSEYSKWMDGAEKVLGEASVDEDDAFEEALKDAPDFPDDDSPSPAPSSPSPSGAGKGLWDRVVEKWSQKWQNLRNWAFGRKTPAERALQKAENQHEAAEKELRTAKVRMEELEKKLTSMEEWELPYSGLDGRCIEKSIGEYKYKICFFDNAKQDSTSIGRWKGFEAPGVASFTAGQYCPGGPERSLKVKFQCGSKEELVDIAEPSRCTYEAQLKHPAACTAELLRALEAVGPRRPLDEL